MKLPTKGIHISRKLSQPRSRCTLASVLCLAGLLGCSGRRHNYWLEVASPTQEWVAAAETTQDGMLDSAETVTSVVLFVPHGNSPPSEVLSFFNRGLRAKERPTKLDIKWTDSVHLDVTYSGSQLVRQTVYYGDVTITLHGPEALSVVPPPAPPQ